jgi:hypothetical protein
MPIDTKTLGTQTPKTLDGRSYPDLLSEVKRLDQPTLNKLALEAPDAKMQSVVSPWISSAEWRGLIKRVEVDEMAGKRRYELTSAGEEKLAEIS